jgi:hypothetical protein
MEGCTMSEVPAVLSAPSAQAAGDRTFILLGLGEWTHVWPTGPGVRVRDSFCCCTSLGLTTAARTADTRCFAPKATMDQHQVQRHQWQLETKAPKIPIFIENSSLSGEEGKKIVTGPRSEQTLSRMVTP